MRRNFHLRRLVPLLPGLVRLRLRCVVLIRCDTDSHHLYSDTGQAA